MNLEDILAGWNGCVCSGEGGSSDFTTAQVIVTASDPDNFVSMATTFQDYQMQIDTPGEYTIILYHGEAQIDGGDVSEISVSGNAEIIDQQQSGDRWMFSVKVTGDCTVAMTGESPL